MGNIVATREYIPVSNLQKKIEACQELFDVSEVKVFVRGYFVNPAEELVPLNRNFCEVDTNRAMKKYLSVLVDGEWIRVRPYDGKYIEEVRFEV